MTVLIVNTRDTDTAGCSKAGSRSHSLVIIRFSWSDYKKSPGHESVRRGKSWGVTEVTCGVSWLLVSWSSSPHYRSPYLETIYQSPCRRQLSPNLTSDAGSTQSTVRGSDSVSCLEAGPEHVGSEVQHIVRAWSTNERVLSAIGVWLKTQEMSSAERTAWTREISATAAESRKGSLKMLALLGSGWPWPALLSSHLSSDSQLQRSEIANSSQFHLASRSNNLQAASSKK